MRKTVVMTKRTPLYQLFERRLDIFGGRTFESSDDMLNVGIPQRA
jgi:hypothetical protein